MQAATCPLTLLLLLQMMTMVRLPVGASWMAAAAAFTPAGSLCAGPLAGCARRLHGHARCSVCTPATIS